MSLKTHSGRALQVLAVLAAAGCGGFHSNQPTLQIYTLDPVAAPAAIQPASGAPSLRVLRPLAAPGLDSEHIALRRNVQRLDYYAASRWPAPVPDFVQSLAIEALRASGKFRSVHGEHGAFAAEQVLQIEIRRFQAEYAGEGAPVVHVQLLATLGAHNDRSVITTLSVEGSAPAAENRMQAVIAAFQGALSAALADLARQLPP